MNYRKFVVPVMFLVAFLASTGCAGNARGSKTRPRFTGDTFINKVEPAPMVSATEDGTPEAVMAPAESLKPEGYAWNETGRCVIQYKLPPATFEYLSQVTVGPCAGDLNLPIGGETEKLNAKGTLVETVRHDLDPLDSRIEVCEIWKPTNNLRVGPGLRSMRLRAPGGMTYTLPFTQTPSSGRRAYDGVYYLNVDFNLTTMYKGKKIDWGIKFYECLAPGF